jgi:hypothetical protein
MTPLKHRIKFCTQELVVFRQNISKLLHANSVLEPTRDEKFVVNVIITHRFYSDRAYHSR